MNLGFCKAVEGIKFSIALMHDHLREELTLEERGEPGTVVWIVWGTQQA